jgi:hypothetical protein
VRFAFAQIVSVNVDDIAANRLGRVEGQRQIFVHRVDRQILHIDGPLVDRIRARVIDDFASHETIFNKEKIGIYKKVAYFDREFIHYSCTRVEYHP